MKQPPIDLERLLSALGDRLEAAGAPPVELLVCGGAAVILQALADRKTSDVDALGRILRREDGTIEVQPGPVVPEFMRREIDRVAIDHGCAGRRDPWFNSAPSALLRHALPAGWERRLHRVRYGNCLVLALLDRRDLIAMKVWACMDGDPHRKHLPDLRAFAPSAEELEVGGRWALEVCPTPEIHRRIEELFVQLGHADVARRIPRPA